MRLQMPVRLMISLAKVTKSTLASLLYSLERNIAGMGHLAQNFLNEAESSSARLDLRSDRSSAKL
jgi:hypothetical protein